MSTKRGTRSDSSLRLVLLALAVITLSACESDSARQARVAEEQRARKAADAERRRQSEEAALRWCKGLNLTNCAVQCTGFTPWLCDVVAERAGTPMAMQISCLAPERGCSLQCSAAE